MKVTTVYRNNLSDAARLDSSYYLSDGNIASRSIEMMIDGGANYFSLGDQELVKIWQPNRNTLSYAADGEAFVPYLQPYDILEFLPEARARISIGRSDVESLKVQEGTILQTCSGRNLGPLVIADKYLESFAFGSDLIRIDICDIQARYYIFAFLNTWMGQAILHSNRTGSVIDHLSALDISEIRIPYTNKSIVSEVALLMKEFFYHYSLARSELKLCKENFINETNTDVANEKLSSGWATSIMDITDAMRFDSAYFNPNAKKATLQLIRAGGIPLFTVADVIKPSGRYKTNYVDPEHGFPIMSGRQLLQDQIVGLKYLPKSSWEQYKNFSLKKDWIAYPADGRVEGRLGTPVMITSTRDGWCASGHVGRIKAHEGIHPGYLYLAMTHPITQAQISALACGSVVDAVYPNDLEKIIIPNIVPFSYDRVIEAWNCFDKANEFKERACSLILANMK